MSIFDSLMRTIENSQSEVQDETTVEENQEISKVDPWKDSRRSTEPEHVHTEIKYGQPGKTSGKSGPILSPDKKLELKKMAEGMAIEMAKEMAPKIAMEMLEKLAEKQEQAKEVVPEEVKKESDQIEIEKGGVPKPGTAPAPLEAEEDEIYPEEVEGSAEKLENELPPVKATTTKNTTTKKTTDKKAK